MPGAVQDDGECICVELDPAQRFFRYADLLVPGDIKKVYRAFDLYDVKEVAWTQVRCRVIGTDPMVYYRIFSEARLLIRLKNEYIVALYTIWYDSEARLLNYITEVSASGNLREYINKHPGVSLNALKKLSKQILEGLKYLHTRSPTIIHRDLNCSNINIDRYGGQVKIANFGAAEKKLGTHSVIGTPQYMAPEMFEGNYSDRTDIYSFGMCFLEMVTKEIPYSECDSYAKIYKKVSAGVKPQALSTMNNPEVKAFIEMCIAEPSARPSASDLLNDAFFANINI